MVSVVMQSDTPFTGSAAKQILSAKYQHTFVQVQLREI